MKYSVSEIENIVKAKLSEKRARHTFDCAHTAKELAGRFGVCEVNAYIAGLLHDITKEETNENQLKLCEKYDIILDSLILDMPQLIHAHTAAYVAKYEFEVSDEIAKAIFYHTTGGKGMKTLDKCLWLADLIEPGRDFPGVEEIRDMAKEDLNRACLMGISRTISYLNEGNKKIHPAMYNAKLEIERMLGQ